MARTYRVWMSQSSFFLVLSPTPARRRIWILSTGWNGNTVLHGLDSRDNWALPANRRPVFVERPCVVYVPLVNRFGAKLDARVLCCVKSAVQDKHKHWSDHSFSRGVLLIYSIVLVYFIVLPGGLIPGNVCGVPGRLNLFQFRCLRKKCESVVWSPRDELVGYRVHCKLLPDMIDDGNF